MSEYKSAEEFIDVVQKAIKWKHAKFAATKEIADHITDQSDAYVSSGLSSEDAICRTLHELGDPKEIGEELDRLHRPRTNWLLMALTVAFLIIGSIADFLSSDMSFTRNILAVGVGCGLLMFLYFADYTVLIRFPRICYFLLLAASALAVAYDARNGFQTIGYSYSFYLLLLFPLVQSGVALQLKNSNSSIGLLWLTLYMVPPLIGSALISSAPAVICLSVLDIALFIYAVRQKWYPVNQTVIIGTICVGILCVMGLIYVNLLTNMWNNFFNVNGNYISEFTRQAVPDLNLIGRSTMSHEIYANNPEYAIARLATRFGTITFVTVILLFAAFVILQIRVIRKQTIYFGKLISSVILFLFSIQFLLSLLGNLGVINGTYIVPFPFIASGGIFTIYNLCLTGILLSVCRYQDIAKDWLNLKSKKATAKEELPGE